MNTLAKGMAAGLVATLILSRCRRIRNKAGHHGAGDDPDAARNIWRCSWWRFRQAASDCLTLIANSIPERYQRCNFAAVAAAKYDSSSGNSR